MSNNTMKAVICTQYGSPEVLKITEISKPVIKDDELLIKNIATSVNSGDIRVRGLVVEGFLKIVMRFVLGFNKPRRSVLGTIFSGVVEAVGKNVQDFKTGDEVYGSTGFKFGTNAAYVAVKENSVIEKKPVNASFEEAAAIAFGGMTAIYFLQKAGITSMTRPKVLIYGATGSVGASAVEIARYYGAEVTAVCSGQGVALAQSLGSDKIVNYTQQDYTRLSDKFDIVLDAVGKTKKKDCAGILKPNGKYLTVGGLDVAKETKVQLTVLKQLFEQGAINANIDRTYTLDDITAAHRYVDTGRKKSNVVVKIGNK